MAYTVTPNLPAQRNDFALAFMEGIIDTDGTALPTMSLTAAANAYNIAADNTAGFHNVDYIEVPGGGKADNSIPYFGVVWSVPNGTSITLVTQVPLLGAVSAAAVSPFYKVLTPFCAKSVELYNQTSGYSYRWRRGMPIDSVEITSPAGVKTFQLFGGIMGFSTCFVFHPSLLSTNSRLFWRVEF